MIAQSTYVLSWLLIFLGLGAGWYILDIRWGTRLHRWWYDMTHRDPLPADIERGFIYNRKARVRLGAAVVVAIFQNILAVINSEVNPLFELLTFFVEVPALMAGFYLGPWLNSLWEKRDSFLGKIDDLEKGNITVSGALKDASLAASEAVRETLGMNSAADEQKRAEADSEISVPEPAISEVSREPQFNPRELINTYLRRNTTNDN